MGKWLGDFQYRFERPVGLERRRSYERLWTAVTGEMMRQMTPAELRHVADVIEAARPTTEESHEPTTKGESDA